MLKKRYTLVVADCRSDVEHRFSFRLGRVLFGAVVCLVVPVLVGIGAALKSKAEVADLYTTRSLLEIENASYRLATEALVEQLHALQTTVNDLGAKANLDPQLLSAMEKLPSTVKASAMGGANTGATLTAITPGLSSPEETFGLLRDLLHGLELRLRNLRSDVDKRNQLAAATPSIWPAHGWLSSSVGPRPDPFTGQPDYHEGLDITGDRGDPVYVTADGVVRHAGFGGAYGNLLTVDHGYGLETRYGHLASIKVKVGDRIKRGEVIGTVGATGRSTGAHLHYEIRVNDHLLNPLRLLTASRR